MKKIIILMVCLWGLGNTFTSAQTTEKEKFISSLMKQMTLDEKTGQLAQCTYRGNFTGPDGGNIPKEEYVRQGRIGSMLNVLYIPALRKSATIYPPLSSHSTWLAAGNISPKAACTAAGTFTDLLSSSQPAIAPSDTSPITNTMNFFIRFRI